MAELDIIRLSSTLAEQRRQQLFQEMEADESIFRNAVMMSARVLEDLKQEEIAVSQQRSVLNRNKADILRTLIKQEVDISTDRERRLAGKFNDRTNGNNVIRDPAQWGFPNYRHVSRDYLWMLNVATR